MSPEAIAAAAELAPKFPVQALLVSAVICKKWDLYQMFCALTFPHKQVKYHALMIEMANDK